MQEVKKYLWVFLLIVWSSYIVWEFQVAKWIQTVEGTVIRVDLIIILPILILFSTYVIYMMVQPSNNNKKSITD